ncbi:MAG TPA: PKD domain-containing protein [Bacteroidia bacterium]|nr:PKD domain-containing protein [Bacteroidia bacterium]
MKTLVLPLILLFASIAQSQTTDTLLYERFETGGTSFSLNTGDEGGVSAAVGYNQWVVNDAYQGGSGQLVCLGIPTTFNVPDTQTQPVGSTGGSSTFYLHIYSDAAQASGILNNSFLAANGLCGGNETYFAAMTQDVSTVAYNTINVSFWWMCGGGPNIYGEVYYSTDGGTTWILVPNTPGQYNNQPTWDNQVMSDAAWAGQATIRFGFRFVNNISLNANDPGFGIDEFLITGETIAAPPVAAFTVSDSTLCEGSCVDFTDISTGNPNSWLWIFQGATTGFSTQQNPTQICYSVPGSYPVTLIIGSAAGTDTLTMNAVTVNANPAIPVITASGDTLTATPGYATYTWYRDSVLVTSTTTNEYVSIQNGVYYVTVTDSNGCSASSGLVALSTGVGEFENAIFKIYPNPTTGIIYLEKKLNLQEIKIFNALGETVWESQENFENDFIDLSAFQEGVYFMMMKNKDGENAVRRVVRVE